MITQKSAQQTVCIVGLGYVGLPLAIRAKEKGYAVYGLDTNQKRVDMINRKKSPIEEKFLEENLPRYPITATTDPVVLRAADVILICVPTPVDEHHYPDLAPVIGASRTIAKHCKKNALIVLESTVNPGVSEEIVRPIFEEAEFIIGKTIFIAHCPERINPGDPKWNVTNIPRVVGSFDKEGLDRALRFYGNIVDAPIRPMRSIREAEAVKIVENSFRDINIAFVNELAKSFDRLDIDVKDVIDGAATKPFAFMPHYPSCGVGGHCIPVDPYYLIEHAKKRGFDHKFLRTARAINNSMPFYTIELLQDALNEIKLPLNGTRIGILGIAYKANIDDQRESPYFPILKILHEHGAKTVSYDPHVRSQSTVRSLEELLRKVDAVVIVTNHDEFTTIEPRTFKNHGIKVIIDGKNCLDKNTLRKEGIIYKGIGR